MTGRKKGNFRKVSSGIKVVREGTNWLNNCATTMAKMKMDVVKFWTRSPDLNSMLGIHAMPIWDSYESPQGGRP